MYCASCDLIISVKYIDAVADWTVRTELQLAADEDILPANNLNLFSAGGTVLGINVFATLAMITLVGGGVMPNSVERGIYYPE